MVHATIQHECEKRYWKKFLTTYQQKFPCSSTLHKIFNRNTVKTSYSCTTNFQHIKRHNKKLTSRKDKKIADCNYRRKQECPMQGKCRAESSPYKCMAKSNNISPKTYLGTSEGDSKTRYYNQTKSFRNLK